MPGDPTVSVVIPTYNRAHLLDGAIQSVLNQTYQDFEIIVVDDASTDNTEEVVKSFDDPRIRYIRHQKNRGGAAARNTGIETARGTYLALLDSDDEWLPRKLERQVKKLDSLSPDYGLVYTLTIVRNDTFDITKKGDFICYKGDVSKQLAGGWCPSITSSVLMRTAYAKESGGFDERFPSFQDYDFWMSFSVNCKFDYVDEYLTIIHQHSGSRVALDYKPRLRGLELFFNKWEQRIKDQCGPTGFLDMREKYFTSAYQARVFRSSRRIDVVRYLRKARQIGGHFGVRFYLKSLLLLVVGRTVFDLLKRAKHQRLSRNCDLKKGG